MRDTKRLIEEVNIAIGERIVSANHPCYVIAEIGVNHNGDLDCARRLIDAAVRTGADAVKFQTFRTSALVTQQAEKAGYQTRQTGGGSQAEMLRALELSNRDFEILRDQCNSSGIDFISTAFDTESLKEVIELGPKCLKWPSGELNNHALLRQAAHSKLPILLSTGMAYLSEVAATLAFLEQEGAGEVAVLQCVSNYPASVAEQNLNCIPAMSAAFGRVTGFSDHTVGPWAAIAARALGMAILEKHITLDRTMAGPDHAASMETDDFTDLVNALREIEIGLGDGVKRPTNAEWDTRKVARKSLVYARRLESGSTIEAEDLTAKRPGTGVSPDKASLFIGRKTVRQVDLDDQLDIGDVV